MCPLRAANLPGSGPCWHKGFLGFGYKTTGLVSFAIFSTQISQISQKRSNLRVLR